MLEGIAQIFRDGRWDDGLLRQYSIVVPRTWGRFSGSFCALGGGIFRLRGGWAEEFTEAFLSRVSFGNVDGQHRRNHTCSLMVEKGLDCLAPCLE